MSVRPYFNFYTADWRDGTRTLNFEQQGFFVRALTIMWDTQDGLPADPKKLGVVMQCDPRKAGRLSKELIGKKKFYERDGKLYNERMMRDLNIDHSLGKTDSKTCGQLCIDEKVPADVSEKSIEKSPGNIPKTQQNQRQKFNIQNPSPDMVIESNFTESGKTLSERQARPPDSKTNDPINLEKRRVSKQALARCADLAPGFDVRWLHDQFLSWDGSDKARDIDKAFLGWVPSFIQSINRRAGTEARQ